REGRVHDYQAKSGVEQSFIVAPEGAPDWAQDRQALWNAAEARETRSNSVTAREWELALPAELDASERRVLVAGFAAELVARYGVAADVAIHAPHREGDQRNWHAHVLTTTRSLTAQGLTDKTRVLDAKQTGGPEIEHMRERWAEMQNHALERRGHTARVDHRSLAAQREAALAQGDEIRAEELDRPAEVKLGPVVSAIERREALAAEREDRAYLPLTERGAQVHEARQARSLLQELGRVRDALREEIRERAFLARETYTHAREEGADRIRAGLAALRAAAQRRESGREGIGREHEEARDSIKDRLARLREPGPERAHEAGAGSIEERLARLRGRGTGPGKERTAETAKQLGAGPEQGQSLGDIRERLGRIREQEQSHTHENIRERLNTVLDTRTNHPALDEGRERAPYGAQDPDERTQKER
ncbi:hypothetical protein FHG66_20270, partial [Rubellimicrobium rubrum]